MDLAGPAPGWPRRRPLGAYAVSCDARWRCALVRSALGCHGQFFVTVHQSFVTVHQSALAGQSPLELQCRMGGARTGLHAQTAARRAPPITAPSPERRRHQKTHVRMRASDHNHTSNNHVCINRPPARPINAGTPRLSPDPGSSSATSQDAHSPSSRARGGSQPRCARGNLKGRPKAWTKMTMGKSGAKAPDRNRGREPPRARDDG